MPPSAPPALRGLVVDLVARVRVLLFGGVHRHRMPNLHALAERELFVDIPDQLGQRDHGADGNHPTLGLDLVVEMLRDVVPELPALASLDGASSRRRQGGSAAIY